MRLPVAPLELKADRSREGPAKHTYPRIALSLLFTASLVVGLIAFADYVDNRPKHHPEYYGDYRGGYARGFEMRAAGDTNPQCETNLRGAYASPRTEPELRARGIYIVGCERGANGKPIGDYVDRVDFLINID